MGASACVQNITVHVALNDLKMAPLKMGPIKYILA